MVWYDTVYVFVSKVKKLAHLLLITVFFLHWNLLLYDFESHSSVLCENASVGERLQEKRK